MSRGKWLAATLLVLVACAAIALGVFEDIAVAYHRRAMMRASANILKVGPNSNEQSDWIERYERHRDALVRYGYLARREFPLVVKPPETNRVWKQLVAEFPDNIHATMDTTEWGSAENKVTVWDRPERMSAWEAAIRKYDLPEARTSASATAPARGPDQ